jgi:hypothetical protein
MPLLDLVLARCLVERGDPSGGALRAGARQHLPKLAEARAPKQQPVPQLGGRARQQRMVRLTPRCAATTETVPTGLPALPWVWPVRGPLSTG